jgi:ubiquinone/menaquinone biosynthesis C-methylase UbiE
MKETEYEKVYGDTFAGYGRSDMDEFIQPFIDRFKANGLNPKEIFEGKKCLDAGCGNGRGSIFMAMNGAKHVEGIDFSHKNVESTNSNAKIYGFDNIHAQQSTIETLPFTDEHFDFVWCNGVLMHTEHPNRNLEELSRVLKIDGQSWIYVYGTGGIYWYTIRCFREVMKKISIDKVHKLLKMMRYSPRYIAEFIDDWYAVFLRAYTAQDFESSLKGYGFDCSNRLMKGVDYDTCHRLVNAKTDVEKDMMGEGDLRYLLTKTSNPKPSPFQIAEGECGSEFTYPESITDIQEELESFFASVSGDDWLLVSACAHLQRELRLIMTENVEFDLPRYRELIQSLTRLGKDIKTLT